MTNLTVENSYSYFSSVTDRPKGSIKNMQDIRKSWNTTVYVVAQSGYIDKYKLLETCHPAKYVYTNGRLSAEFLPAMAGLDGDDTGYYSPFYLEQYGVSRNDTTPERCSAFQSFFDANAALEYSEYLKNHVEYLAGVARHHAACSALFSDLFDDGDE